MGWWNRFALWLWRDRYDHDPATGTGGEQHNISLWNRLRPARERLLSVLLDRPLWPAFVGGIGAVSAMYYLDIAKTDQQVHRHSGELLLRCVHEPDHALRCHPVPGERSR